MGVQIILVVSIFFVIGSTHAQSVEESVRSIVGKTSYPQSLEEFKPLFHFAPVNQDTTNICWSFSTISFIETEMQRLGLAPVKLSVMYPVYFAFVEKAKYFVQSRGASRFKAGDLFTTVLWVIQTYGLVPESAYRGQAEYSPVYNHKVLERELENYITRVKDHNLWDEPMVIREIKSILDKHLGAPPAQFQFENKTYTPLQFADQVVRLPWQDYWYITSFSYDSLNHFITLNVPDNWRRLDCYYNIPLDLFYNSLKSAVRAGFSVAIDGDLSEPGRYGPADIAIIPDFDIAGSAINQQARELRFEQGSTTDDHLMHVIGYTWNNGDWFLVKDSWRDAWEGNVKGYFFFSGDFIKLKVLAYLVHKDGIPEITKLIRVSDQK
jgi:bleomycin hydrolase